MTPEPSVLLVGAGAVGCYLAGHLSIAMPRQTPPLTLVGRPAVQDAIRRHGLVVRELDHDLVSHPPVLLDISSAPPAEFVLLTVRAYDLPTILPHLPRLVADTGRVLALQNGVGSDEQIADVVGPHRVISATITTRVDLEAPGIVQRTSQSGGIALASMDGSPIPGSLLGLLTQTELSVRTVGDYRSLRWSKLLLNMIGAATSAIVDIDMSDLVANPSLFRIEQLAFREATRVMAAQSVPAIALPGYPVPLVRAVMRMPRPAAQRLLGPRLARSRAGRSPMLRTEVARGKTEVRWLNGAVYEAGARLRVRVPVNAALTALVETVTADPVAREEFRGHPTRLVNCVQARRVRP